MPRTKGAKNLSKQEQAAILAQKNAQLCSQEKIADNFGVARRTVVGINESSVDEETLALSRKYQRELSTRIDRINDKILDSLEAQVDAGEIPANHLSTIFGTLYDKQRLHNNQPTNITQNLSDEERALEIATEFIKRLIQRNFAVEKAVAAAVQEFPGVDSSRLLTSAQSLLQPASENNEKKPESETK